MMQIFKCLLVLLFFANGPALKGNADFWHSSIAAKGATHWGNPKTLADHFGRHGADFSAKSAHDYTRMASDFFRRSQTELLPTKIATDGTIRVYDPKNNIFGSYNPSGTTKTFYKPDPAQHKLPSNLDYWNKQPGISPWQP